MKDEKKSEKKDIKKVEKKDAEKNVKKTASPAKTTGTDGKKAASPAKATGTGIKKAAGTSSAKTDPKNLAEQAFQAVSEAVENVKGGMENLNFTDMFHHADKMKPEADTRSKLFQKICGFIPGKINNSTVLSAFELMRKQQRIMKKDFSANLSKNKKSFENHSDSIKKNKGFIEDQMKWTDTAYGDSTMQYSGCEIFAAFNAIWSILGKSILSLPELISEFEKDGMVLSGKFGTAPKAIADLLEKNGFKTELCTEEKDFDSVGKRNESLILTMYNDKNDITQEVHTINISKKDGKYIAHNVYCNGKVIGPFNSVSDTIRNINNGKAKGISLIGIKRK